MSETDDRQKILYVSRVFLNLHLRICLLTSERKEGRERNDDVRNIDWLPPTYMPQLGIKPATKVCALTGNRTYNLLVDGITL